MAAGAHPVAQATCRSSRPSGRGEVTAMQCGETTMRDEAEVM